MKRGTKKPTRQQSVTALDQLSDLLSDASPNCQTDPWSWQQRQRSIERMTPAQLKRFATLALTVLEYHATTLAQ